MFSLMVSLISLHSSLFLSRNHALMVYLLHSVLTYIAYDTMAR